MKVIVFGNGQLAKAIEKSRFLFGDVIKLDQSECDITDFNALTSVLTEYRPEYVFNAAAYTAVDLAESDREQAFRVNADAPQKMAEICADIGAHFTHISTDFVFNGNHSEPYSTADLPDPINIYGESKLKGEIGVLAFRDVVDCAVIRTSWVYSDEGKNFPLTMLKLMKDRDDLSVVGDQIGTPTWAQGLADICWLVARKRLTGLYHWSDAGVASWYDFAVAVQRIGLELGLLDRKIPIKDISSGEYPTPARRPKYSVMDKSELKAALSEVEHIHWEDQLRAMMMGLK